MTKRQCLRELIGRHEGTDAATRPHEFEQLISDIIALFEESEPVGMAIADPNPPNAKTLSLFEDDVAWRAA